MYYEFNKPFPYYALIYAENEEDSKKCYEETVADLDDIEDDEYPDLVTKETAIELIRNAEFELEEERKEVVDQVEMGKFTDAELILVDLSLIW